MRGAVLFLALEIRVGALDIEEEVAEKVDLYLVGLEFVVMVMTMVVVVSPMHHLGGKMIMGISQSQSLSSGIAIF